MRRLIRFLYSPWSAPVLTLGLLLVLFVVVPAASAAPYDPTATTAKSCAFGANMGDGIMRIIAGAIVGLLFLAVGLAAIFQRMHSGGGGAGSAIMSMLMGGLDAGGAVFLLGMFGTFAAIAITAAGLIPCP